ncbi:glycine betaine ABC transporter substrate-binding protein [Desulfonema magnum]|uniref:Glycine betaine/proline betaine transport system, substrate-binding protein n=1 Tax=Desulfonema magnum TaxID=45655 RepID=A0A975BKU6_9BACT|nr:glycine betaine ABC transporter substrate-binding protein [Desulfonema magnum]QTA86950.1 Glycine betaine/proline betaine transport system, substrate-binding protein [Desulfonema magnum]
MKRLTKTIVGCVFLAVAAIMILSPAASFAESKKLVIGSKEFTEQRILGKIMIVLLEKNGFECTDKTGLGGTSVARKALENRQIDVYMEYTGTALMTILKHKKPITDPQKCYEIVKQEDLEKNGLAWLPFMAFNNTYCLMMQRTASEKLGIKSLSDLAKYVNSNPDKIAFGVNAEFYARPDGYRHLQRAYGFKFPKNKIVKMESGLLYKALKEGQIDVGLGFATDGRIKGFDLVALEDDRQYFPVYNPAPVLKREIAEKYPELEDIFKKLGEKLNTEAMSDLNYQVDIEHKNVKDVATDWLKRAGLI